MEKMMLVANEKLNLFIEGDFTINPIDILTDMHERFIQEFEGWEEGLNTAIRYRLPKKPEAIYDQFPSMIRTQLEALLEAPQFLVDGDWYCFSKASADLKGISLSDLDTYIRFRVRLDKEMRTCQECKEIVEPCSRHARLTLTYTGRANHEVPELLVEHDWCNTTLLIMRGYLIKEEALIPIWP